MKNVCLKVGVVGRKARRGSALLITLLLLGVLMTLTLGISTLVIREIHVTQSVVDANKAYYAAEAGVERGLGNLSKQKAGFEASGGFEAADAEGDAFLKKFDPTYSYSFSVSNQSDSVPSFPDKQPIFADKIAISGAGGEQVVDCQLSSNSNPTALAYSKEQLYQDCPRATYRKLGLNETAIIPLFSAVDGGTVSVNDFLVEYYLNLRDGSDLYPPFNGMKLEDFDVLRWKIYGQPLTTDNGVQKTESIADFYPGVNNNAPDRPVCIGTDASVRAVTGAGVAAETCMFPSLSKKPPTKAELAGTENLNDVTLWSAARECYQTDAGSAVTGGALIKGTTIGDFTGCSMRDFIDNHKENYLILTNMVNPNVAGIANINDPAQLARADIYYRVIARKDDPASAVKAPKLVKDFAEIHSQGFASGGSVAKTLDVRYKAPGFLPVFNFSLYKVSETASLKP